MHSRLALAPFGSTCYQVVVAIRCQVLAAIPAPHTRRLGVRDSQNNGRAAPADRRQLSLLTPLPAGHQAELHLNRFRPIGGRIPRTQSFHSFVRSQRACRPTRSGPLKRLAVIRWPHLAKTETPDRDQRPPADALGGDINYPASCGQLLRRNAARAPGIRAVASGAVRQDH